MDEQLAIFERWRADPVTFVREVFGATPDAWQLDALEHLITDPRIVMSACKGPGKSCLLAWIIWWFLAVNPDAQILALSITADNLRDNLWKELALWYGRAAPESGLALTFEMNTERIEARASPATWWCSARSFAKQADPEAQANTLAGLHADHVMIVLDELGDYPEGVVAASEGIFANAVDAHIIGAGNPTKPRSPLVKLTRTSGWYAIYITGDPDDPKRSPRISLEWARKMIDDYGRDNPWVMVNVLGLPPPASEDQLISDADVIKAQARDTTLEKVKGDAIVWGLDPSRSLDSGADEAALMRRRGIAALRPHTWRGKDGPQLATEVGKLLLEAEKVGELPDAIFVDVGGVGASAFDHLKLLGWGALVHAVDFGGKADDDRFADKRSEMWWEMAQWTKKLPSCLPKDAVLAGEMVAPLFKFDVRNKRTCFFLESKKDMKKRGVPSPNRADALCLTFAAKVVSRTLRQELELGTAGAAVNHAATEYNPYARSA